MSVGHEIIKPFQSHHVERKFSAFSEDNVIQFRKCGGRMIMTPCLKLYFPLSKVSTFLKNPDMIVEDKQGIEQQWQMIIILSNTVTPWT